MIPRTLWMIGIPIIALIACETESAAKVGDRTTFGGMPGTIVVQFGNTVCVQMDSGTQGCATCTMEGNTQTCYSKTTGRRITIKNISSGPPSTAGVKSNTTGNTSNSKSSSGSSKALPTATTAPSALTNPNPLAGSGAGATTSSKIKLPTTSTGTTVPTMPTR